MFRIFLCLIFSVLLLNSNCSIESSYNAGDTQPPIPGTEITFSDISESGVTVSWGEAKDETTLQATDL